MYKSKIYNLKSKILCDLCTKVKEEDAGVKFDAQNLQSKIQDPMFDMMKMMGKMKEVQARMKESQEKLGNMYATGESGGGLVKAKVSGKKQLISLDVDPSLLKAEDKGILQDLIVAAVNKASEEAEALAKEEMRKSTEGLLPNIPGLDLSNLMG